MNFVAAITSNDIRIVSSTIAMQEKIRAMGGQEVNDYFELKFSTTEELAFVLQQLQSIGLYFADEPAGWPPAAIFQQYWDKGLLHGTIKTVSWCGPNNPIYRDV